MRLAGQMGALLLGPISTEGTAGPCALRSSHCGTWCHRSGGTVATLKPLLCSRVRKDITYPELNQSHNCSNVLVLGVVALGLCVHMQTCTPHPISMFFHCSNTATSPPPTSARRAASLPSPLKSCALCCALTSGAVSGRLPACAPCLGPTSPTFTVFT